MSAKKNVGRKQRIALYGRIAADQPEAADMQKQALKQIVAEHPEWVLQDLYFDVGPADPGLENTPALKRMLKDAARGCFDRVVTMKVSRIAREPCSLLKISRRLKEHGIEIDFLAEGISTEYDTLQALMR